MPAGVYYDGDFTTPSQVGLPNYKQPFPADPQAYVYTVTYWQLLDNYVTGIKDLPGPYGGHSTGVDEFYRDEGGGVVSFNREYAAVPALRSEYETFIYDYHFAFYNWGFPDSCVEPVTLRVNSRLQFDYFWTTQPDLFIPLERAPQILDTCVGRVFLGDYLTLINPQTPTGTEILAEDAAYKVWKGNIYERRQRFIKWISLADLIFEDA